MRCCMLIEYIGNESVGMQADLTTTLSPLRCLWGKQHTHNARTMFVYVSVVLDIRTIRTRSLYISLYEDCGVSCFSGISVGILDWQSIWSACWSTISAIRFQCVAVWHTVKLALFLTKMRTFWTFSTIYYDISFLGCGLRLNFIYFWGVVDVSRRFEGCFISCNFCFFIFWWKILQLLKVKHQSIRIISLEDTATK